MRCWAALAVVLALSCGDRGLNRVVPQLKPPGSPVDFGLVPVLNDVSAEVPVQNLGRARMNVSNVALAQDDGIFSLSDFPTEVAGGDLRPIVVHFVPKAEQAYANSLTFDTDDADNPHVQVDLTGTGSTRAIMALDPATLEFGRVGECGSAVQVLTILSKGTADLIVEEIAFADGTYPGFAFVGSTKTPATVPPVGANGLPGQIQLTLKLVVAAGTTGDITGGVRLRSTDPDQTVVVVPLHATVNRAPVPAIAPLGNGAPGQLVTLDGSGTVEPDGDTPLSYKWTIRSKPLSSDTTIAQPDVVVTTMRLDATLPGSYEVQLEATDSLGVKSCQPARATIVAAPAEKLLVELFWDNSVTDLDLHVERTPTAPLFTAPDDCFYQNRAPDWGLPGPTDDPLLKRDALTGYGPEVFGYVNPIDTTYRVTVVFANDHLSATPTSTATVRVYEYGVLKAELTRALLHANDVWPVADVAWPTGGVTAL